MSVKGKQVGCPGGGGGGVGGGLETGLEGEPWRQWYLLDDKVSLA